jgi:hypothetical protein
MTEQLVKRMGEAAANFLASLTPDQKAKALCALDDDERRTFWHYTPILRDGLPLTEMDYGQQKAALKLVATGLSRAGYVTASTIMGLETALDAIEGWSFPPPGRDSRRFYVRIFGSPGAKNPWGWSFEGHHISLNYTIVDGRIVAPTPTFFGANPAESPLGDVHTLRPLQGVEDLARELVHALDESQRSAAIVAPSAPIDILTTNRPYATGETVADALHAGGHDVADGLTSSMLSSGQAEVLTALIGEYIHRMPDALAEIEMRKLHETGIGSLHFAWAGGIERHQPHYYRIVGPQFLVEYDNTQNDANHIHSVWRAPGNDFGADILARHYAHSH